MVEESRSQPSTVKSGTLHDEGNRHLLRMVEQAGSRDEVAIEYRCLCPNCYEKRSLDPLKGEEVLKKGQTVLKESMEEFSKVIASDKRFKHLHHLDILDKPDPKFEDLLSTVKSAIDQWETRDRKLGRRIPYYFRSFCKHLNAYSNLLSLIPSQSVYCSLISGAIQVIVKASVNYEAIAEAFSEGLYCITMKIEPIEQALEIHRSDRIIALAHDLYSHFFFFLAHTLNFFEASLIKRTFTCLNQSLVTDLKQEAQLVADIALCIFQHFQVAHMQFERNSTLSQRSQAVDVRVIFVGNLQEGWDTRWTDESANNLLRLLKGQHQSEIWRLEAAPADGEDEQVSNRRVASQAAAKTPENASQSTEKKEDRLSDRHADRHTCDDLLKRTASLELQIQYSPMKVMAIIEDNTAYTQWDSWAAIESWTASPQSRALGIAKEEYEEAYPSSLSPLASSMVESAMKLKIPVIAYFCGWPSDDYNGEDKATREKRCFLDMILCLLRSLICVLPEEFEADFDLSDSRIQKMCDGSPENLVEALSLFEDLLDLAPSTLFIILDGIDHLEFTSVEENLKNLVKLLLKRLAAEDPSRSTHTAKAIKLLVTTAASALSLEELESPWVDVVTESSYMGRKGRYYTERQEWGI